MASEIYPLYILPATHSTTQDAIRFRQLDGSFLDSKKHQPLVWRILETATGRLTQRELAQKLVNDFPDINNNIIEASIEQLLAAGVLVDSIAVSDILHEYTNNPTRFSRHLSAKMVVSHAKSPRLPVKKGNSVKIKPLETSSLAKLQAKRRTVRTFKEDPLDLEELGHILTATYSLPLHSTPSAGALYPLKIYVIVLQGSKNLVPGYYEYDPETHTLVLFDAILDVHRVMYSLNDEELLGSAPVIITIAADMKRNQFKYGNRGYRLLLLEAGHAAQNLQLAATEQQLGCLEYGGFQDQSLRQLFKLTEQGEQHIAPLITLAVGKVASRPLTKPDRTTLIERLREELIGEGKPFDTIGLADFKTIWLRHVFIRALKEDGSYLYGAGGTSESSQTATLKALAEAYERHTSSQVRVDREATAADLIKEDLDWLDPRAIVPLTDDHFGSNGPMEKFSDTLPLQWVKGKYMEDGGAVWAPIDMVYYPLHAERWKRKALCWSSSSGVAAFSDTDTASLKALLELLERHCLMSLWHTRKKPTVIPTRLLPIAWRERVKYWSEEGKNVHVLDISSGYGEVTLKVIIESTSTYPHYINGAASSLVSFEDALAKAFQEVQIAAETIVKTGNTKQLLPKDVKTVTNHGEYYAQASGRDQISWIWQGTKARKLPQPTTTKSQLIHTLNPAVFTLSTQDAPLVVVRVICEKLLPIGFGFGNTHHLHATVKDSTHPDSLNLPHDFA